MARHRKYSRKKGQKRNRMRSEKCEVDLMMNLICQSYV